MKNYIRVTIWAMAIVAAFYFGFKQGKKVHAPFIDKPYAERPTFPPYEIYTKDLISFDLTTLRCPLCGSDQMTKEAHHGFYAIGCRICGTEGKVVEK